MGKAAIILYILIALLIGAGGGYWGGARNGAAAQQAKQDRQAVTDLSAIIESHTDLVDKSNAASVAMRTATAAREKEDSLLTGGLNHALALTAHTRAGCVFDAGVLRQLQSARDRAADAAASGVRGALPSPAASAAHR